MPARISTRSFSDGTDFGFAHGFLSKENSQRLCSESSRTARIGAYCSSTRRTNWIAWAVKEYKRTQFGPDIARREKELFVCLDFFINSFRGINDPGAGDMGGGNDIVLAN